MQQTLPALPELLGVQATAAVLRRSPDTVRKLFRLGLIRTTRIGGRLFTTEAELRRALSIDPEGRIISEPRAA